MRAAVGIVAALAATAHGQPVTRPSQVPCTVQVLEGPEAVRAEIERWVRAEPRCERELVVRVTPSRGGLRLVATGTDGRVRERVVPDAQSAAVLVVSWMADDSIDDALDEATPVQAAPTPPPPPPLSPPSSVRELAPEVRVRVPARMLQRRWLSFGASAGTAFGLHGQLDLFSRGAWTLGVAGDLREADDRMHRGGDVAGGATAFLAYTQRVGPIDLRAQLGIGAAMRGGDPMSRSGVEPTAQAGLFVRAHLGDDWGVLAGPLVDADLDSRAIGISGYAGLERRW
ncbi:MAG: hypothetical protein JO257_21420 [Deltaproteobacteria bacterium]|nr:hypothetical protein [Deltaproteobacteria bacterium]